MTPMCAVFRVMRSSRLFDTIPPLAPRQTLNPRARIDETIGHVRLARTSGFHSGPHFFFQLFMRASAALTGIVIESAGKAESPASVGSTGPTTERGGSRQLDRD